jgi:lactoylglutathione lyase
MRYLHTMIRVTDLERSKRFYCEGLGFTLVSERRYEDGRFTLVFLRAPGDVESGPMLELTHNWDTDRYELGTGFGHVAIAVDDIYRRCDELRGKGARIVREPGPMKHGTTEIAFVEDPDGYRIELIQARKPPAG